MTTAAETVGLDGPRWRVTGAVTLQGQLAEQRFSSRQVQQGGGLRGGQRAGESHVMGENKGLFSPGISEP